MKTPPRSYEQIEDGIRCKLCGAATSDPACVSALFCPQCRFLHDNFLPRVSYARAMRHFFFINLLAALANWACAIWQSTLGSWWLVLNVVAAGVSFYYSFNALQSWLRWRHLLKVK